MNPPIDGIIQGLLKAFECFSSTFQGKFNLRTFQESPLNSSTFQACANTEGVKKVHSAIKLCSYYFSHYVSNDINVTGIL